MVRTVGSDAHFGYMLAIHSLTMLFGVFFLTILTYKFSSYTLIITGGLIGSLSSALLIFETEYVTIIVFVVLISIGEALWVPRLLDYTLEIAPETH